MGDVVEFKKTDRMLRKELEKERQEMANNLYHITRGFEFPGQNPDVREGFDRGDFEL